jgi:hypothetical protein
VVFREIGNFPSWGVDFGHCVGGFCGSKVIFPLWGIDLGHCVGGFGWFRGK